MFCWIHITHMQFNAFLGFRHHICIHNMLLFTPQKQNEEPIWCLCRFRWSFFFPVTFLLLLFNQDKNVSKCPSVLYNRSLIWAIWTEVLQSGESQSLSKPPALTYHRSCPALERISFMNKSDELRLTVTQFLFPRFIRRGYDPHLSRGQI